MHQFCKVMKTLKNKIIENINFANSQLTDYLPERLDDVDNYLITIEDKNETLYKINFINNIFCF